MQDWITLQHMQHEQTQITQHQEQKHDAVPLGSDARVGPHHGRGARAGKPALQNAFVSKKPISKR